MIKHDLIKKMNFQNNQNILLFDVPSDMHDFDEVVCDYSGQKAPYDMIFSFIFEQWDLEVSIKEVYEKSMIKPNGLFYIAYPKKEVSINLLSKESVFGTVFKIVDEFDLNEKYSVFVMVNKVE